MWAMYEDAVVVLAGFMFVRSFVIMHYFVLQFRIPRMVERDGPVNEIVVH